MVKKPEQEEQKTTGQIVREWIRIVVLAIFLALVVRAFVVQGYKIENASMEDTLLPGDYILAEKVTCRHRLPHRGEIVVFRYPLNPDKIFVKRCIALPGDTVVIRNKVVYINGRAIPDYPGVKFVDSELLSGLYSARDNFGPVVVPRKSIFVLGDNRDVANDSRFWGPLPAKNIEGRPLFIYFSIEPPDWSPRWPFPLSLVERLLYYIFGTPMRIRWGRIGRAV
ncbi:MAG TPA: signal peptidase I [candidate division Zixibacteria bacterium]|nr:signal peptidase I [candidate division Zixibacteria bacterium]